MNNREYYENKRYEIINILKKNYKDGFFITSDINYKYEKMFLKLNFYFIQLS